MAGKSLCLNPLLDVWPASEMGVIYINPYRFAGGGGGGGGSIDITYGWETDTTDWTLDSRWTRDSGGTPSSGTGPSTGSSGSFYLFFESSSCGIATFDATLDTDLSSYSGINVTFDWQWRSETSSGWSAYLRLQYYNGSSWVTVWEIYGPTDATTDTDATIWNTGETVDLTGLTVERIRFQAEALENNPFRSDFALDQVRIHN